MPTPPSAPVNRRSRKGWLWAVLALVVISIPVGYVAVRGATSLADEPLTFTVASTDMRITVTERGTLESQKTVNGICEIEGYDNKIIFIVEEGSTVKQGDVVVRFDSAQIDKEIAEENLEMTKAVSEVESKKQELEVAKNTGESEIATAELELTLAKLDLEKYANGDYLVSLSDLKGKIALAEIDLEKADSALKNTRDLLKKGFREPEQVRVAEQEVARAKFYLQRDQESLKMTETYDHKRKLTEFDAKAKEADRKLSRAKSTADANARKAQGAMEGAVAELELQKEDKAEAEKQKERCEIKAMQSGVVAYANEEWWSESRRIREGATVYERQVVFFIPDMELMQVEVKIHESEVKRIAAGQKAVIRVDAFANQPFTGTVKSVAQLSKSDGYFGGGVKEYTTIVVLDEKAQVALRPGMTAEVEILVDNMKSVLAVPVQGVAEHRGKHFVYLQVDKKIERAEVEIGATNNRMVVVKSGLKVGDVIALDARSRAAEEFKDAKETENEDVTKLANQSEVSKAAAAKDATSKAADPKDAAKTDAAKTEEAAATEETKPDTTSAQPTAEPATSVEDTNKKTEAVESAPAPSTTQP